MNAREFLHYWQRVVTQTWDSEAKNADGAAQWTEYVTSCLHMVASEAGLWCACTHGSHIDGQGSKRGEHSEYLFDLTWYESVGASASEYSLPKVIIEHENQHSFQEFQLDHWKTLFGYAPLRIAIGYCRSAEERIKWVDEINQQSAGLLWQFPQNCEDLIILGYAQMDCDYTYYVRPQYGREWKPYKM